MGERSRCSRLNRLTVAGRIKVWHVPWEWLSFPPYMSCLCDQCSGLCCRYFVLEIDTPTTRAEFDNIRWYLVHENVFVFIEKKKWYLGIYARCKHLQGDNRCGIYATRPQICRKYSTENCDYHGGDYNWSVLFSSAEQLEAYAKERLAEIRLENRGKKKRSRPKRKKALPKLKPVLMTLGAMGHGKQNGNGNGRGVALPVLGG